MFKPMKDSASNFWNAWRPMNERGIRNAPEALEKLRKTVIPAKALMQSLVIPAAFDNFVISSLLEG
jgi:hypothetical protein